MKRVLLSMVLLVALSSAASAISVKPGIFYSGGTDSSTQTYIAVGIPLTINRPFYFEDLGFYGQPLESGQTVNVFLQSWTPSPLGTSPGPVPFPLASVTNAFVSIGSESPGVFGTLWGEVNNGNGLVLIPGTYVLWASLPFSFPSTPPTYRPFMAADANSSVELNTFSGAITYGYFHNNQYHQPYVSYINGTYGFGWVSGSAPIMVFGGNISVPEPSTYALMASVGVALYLLRRRRNQAAKN